MTKNISECRNVSKCRNVSECRKLQESSRCRVKDGENSCKNTNYTHANIGDNYDINIDNINKDISYRMLTNINLWQRLAALF